MADIKRIGLSFGERGVTQDDYLQALQREVYPGVEALLRKVNDEIIPKLNGLAGDVSDLEGNSLVSVSNLASEGLLSKSGTTVQGKGLVAGTGISLVAGGSTLTISSSSSTARAITTAAYSYTGSALRYVPIGGGTAESSSISSLAMSLPINFGGRLVSVSIVSNQALGSTIVGFHKAENTTPTVTETVNMASADTPYEFDFGTDATVSDGDFIQLSVDPQFGGGSQSLMLHWEINL